MNIVTKLRRLREEIPRLKGRPNEPVVIDCPNTECHKKIESHYPPLYLLFEQVNSVIPSSLEHDNKKDEEEFPVELSAKKEVGSLGCPHHFGYLANHHKDAFPDECLICPRLLKCMVSSER